MKKILLCLIVVLMLTGCGVKYKEGVYEDYVMEEYNGQNNKVTAKIEVDKNGKISNVYLDSTYTTSEGVHTTKKTLGNAYGMKGVSSNMGKIEGGAEWYEQVEALEKAVVNNQGIDFIKLNENKTTDSVTGCTISIDGLYRALEKTLEKAKK